jgi:hypothetical protein
MGDMGDIFRSMRKEKKERQAKNYERLRPMDMLIDKGIGFHSTNGGTHVMIYKKNSSDIQFDFWPTTGKWKNRETNKYHHGVHSLIKAWEK